MLDNVNVLLMLWLVSILATVQSNVHCLLMCAAAGMPLPNSPSQQKSPTPLDACNAPALKHSALVTYARCCSVRKVSTL